MLSGFHFWGSFGFSGVGLLFLLMLFVPNVLWARWRPDSYTSAGENRFLLSLERIGQAATSACALLCTNFNLRPWTPWSAWLAAAFLVMCLYEVWWIRYFRSQRREADFYTSLLGVPLAGATLPVAAFFLLGLYGRVGVMLVAVTVLGTGHIGIHFEHCRQAAGCSS